MSTEVGQSGSVEPTALYVQWKHRLAELLVALEEALRRAELAGLAEELHRLLAKLAEERFNIAVVGQFKRGKSSLLNAVIGSKLLPTGVLPLTSAVTSVEYGSKPELIILREGSRLSSSEPVESLRDYVTEEGNPGNRKRVVEARVKLPLGYLRRGIAFVDTPGIGSTIRANSETTYGYLPMIDAALFVTSVESPFSEAERELLAALRGRVPRIFFVVNKIDLVSTDERERVLAYAAAEIARCTGSPERLYGVSAREALEGGVGNGRASGTAAGLGELATELAEFLSADRGLLLLRSVAGAAVGVLERARALGEGRMDRAALERHLRAVHDELSEAAALHAEGALPSVIAGLREACSAGLSERVDELLSRERDRDQERRRLTIGEMIAGLEQRIDELSQPFLDRFADDLRAFALDRLEHALQSRRRDIEAALGARLETWPGVAEARAAARFAFRIPARRGEIREQSESLYDLLPISLAVRLAKRSVKRAAERLVDRRVERLRGESGSFAAATVEACERPVRDRLRGARGETTTFGPELMGELVGVGEELTALIRGIERGRSPSDVRAEREVDLGLLASSGGPSARAAHSLSAPAATAAPTAPTPSPERGTDLGAPRRPAPAYGCPVCGAVQGALFDLFVAKQSSLVHDPAARRSFAESGGYCALHTWQFEQILSPYTASVAFADLVESTAMALDHAAQREIPDSIPGDPAAGGAACEACATTRSIEVERARELLRDLASEEGRARYAEGFGLCVGHLRLLAHSGASNEILRFLFRDVARKLALRAEDMREYALKRAARRAGSTTDEQDDAWLRALRLLVGDRNVSYSAPEDREL